MVVDEKEQGFQGFGHRVNRFTFDADFFVLLYMKLEKEKYSIMPKRASGSSILHNLPKNKGKTPDLQHVNLPFLSAVKNNPPREERSTCYTVSVPLHRSTISRPKIIQIFSKPRV